MKEFSLDTRQKNLSQLEGQEYDLLIIGGGITGAGVARDAAGRGMKVALVEMQDFAEGTSSRSSKLIHGGIRYLENMEFGLVFEALRERARLFDMAPHLVHPLRFLLPIYQGDRVGPFLMGVGMWLYDILSLFEVPKMHESLSRSQTLGRVPTLKDQDLRCSFEYSDAYMDDDRLVIETLRSANEAGAHSLSYIKAKEAIKDQEQRVKAVVCEDRLSGKTYTVRAKHIVSSVGPWTDEVGSGLLGRWKSIMRPSKGIHLTVPRQRFPLSRAIVMATGADRRIIFAIPRNELVILGTTDTDFKGDPTQVQTTIEDVEYLLKIVNNYFPKVGLQQQDLTASYSGVRPLVHDGSASESKTSREHVIFTDPRGITFVTGGKYTTYREMAEEVVDQVLSQLTVEEQSRFASCQTVSPLNPLVTQEKLSECLEENQSWAEQLKVDAKEVAFLTERHGMEAWDLFEKHRDAIGKPAWVWRLEARQALQSGMCFHLTDFYLRRVPLFLNARDHGMSVIEDVAEEFSRHLGWSPSEIESQKQGLRDHLHSEMGWRHKSQ